ncbi:protein of unknown function [Filimonas lacunae]|uniref:DUF4288 domain-containing protein n=1 Tax=Filimonas lacunae TaxID=477680 RepID=A0A173MK83_9BACT|nr:DUF4288 domain-containing protein [Filimonas lacunae]BAV08055.1 hypothetical protein FLA_4088 [Filimonas lacunae]SIT08653.1 protein of unknown function [Filimonas lacunae]
MNWYLAKIVYRIICGDGDHTPQFDEQLRLIEAEDGLQAFNKAQAMGEREQETFLNQQHSPVQWKFINVSELHRLDKLTDGAEIYSRIKEEEDADIYVHMTNVRAAQLLDKHSHEFIESL